MSKIPTILAWLLVLSLGLLAFYLSSDARAAVNSYTTVSGDTISKVASTLGLTVAEFATTHPSAQLRSGQTFTVSTPTPPPQSGEVILTNVYNTAYGWPDNTPPGGAISHPGLHQSAGGVGTFADPITLAVGHSITNGKDVPDFAAGTKWYSPNLRKYFIVEDTCGDGSAPQNGPCHRSEISGTIQIDIWVGGQGASKSAVLNCENAVTRVGTFVRNPKSTYVVVAGPVFNGTCAKQYGDTLVIQ